MNPIQMMQLKPLLEKFQKNHPKIPMFLSAASNAIAEDTVLAVSVTTAEGKKIETNLRVNQDDLELIAALQKLVAKK